MSRVFLSGDRKSLFGPLYYTGDIDRIVRNKIIASIINIKIYFTMKRSSS